MTDKRKSWWSELSKGDDHVEREWIQWIELVAGLSAMIVLTLSLSAGPASSRTDEADLAIQPHDLAEHVPESRRCGS
jgi:hypothetical protein